MIDVYYAGGETAFSMACLIEVEFNLSKGNQGNSQFILLKFALNKEKR